MGNLCDNFLHALFICPSRLNLFILFLTYLRMSSEENPLGAEANAL